MRVKRRRKKGHATHEKLCGIYYLVDYVESGVLVLYIGATKDLWNRIRRHRVDQDVQFCGVFFDPCRVGELEKKKAAAIAEFQPRSAADCECGTPKARSKNRPRQVRKSKFAAGDSMSRKII